SRAIPAGDDILAELERLTSKEEFATVHALAADALALARDQRSEAFARYYLGLACISVAQPDLGSRYIRRARLLFEQLGDERMAVDALDWEATGLYLTESSEALPLELEALRRCRLLRPVAPQIESRIRGHLGAIYVA